VCGRNACATLCNHVDVADRHLEDGLLTKLSSKRVKTAVINGHLERVLAIQYPPCSIFRVNPAAIATELELEEV